MSNLVKMEYGAMELAKPLPLNPEYVVGDIMNSPAVSRSEKSMILGSLYLPKIIQMDPSVVRVEVRAAVVKAIWDSGFKEEIEEQRRIISAVTEDVLMDFSDFTIWEVQYAFRHGIRKHYGDYFGIHPKTFYGFLQAYRNQTKNTVLPLLRKIQPSGQQKEPTLEDKLEIRKEWLESVKQYWRDFKKTGEWMFSDYGNRLYDYLEKNNVVNLSKEQRQLAWKQARASVKMRNVKTKGLSVPVIRQMKEKLVKIENMDNSILEEIRIQARYIALRMVVEELRVKNVDFEKILDGCYEKDKNGGYKS